MPLSLRTTARALLIVVLLLLVALVVIGRFEAGRGFIVRSYVRAERMWSRDLPIVRARGAFRRLEPLLSRLGVWGPVRLEVEPGVSLLLDPEDDIARTILIGRQGKWEPEVWAAIASGLSKGAVFFDVGAHIGYDSLKGARLVGESGSVVAFEPNPNTLALLRANIEASRAGNVIVEPIACTEAETTLTLFDSTPGGNSGSSSLSQANAGARARPYTVRGRPIDDVVAELGLTHVDVLKADVEGAELLVLRGAAQTLRRFHPVLVLEEVPRQLRNMNASVEELDAFVKASGYGEPQTVDYKNKRWTVR